MFLSSPGIVIAPMTTTSERNLKILSSWSRDTSPRTRNVVNGFDKDETCRIDEVGPEIGVSPASLTDGLAGIRRSARQGTNLDDVAPTTWPHSGGFVTGATASLRKTLGGLPGVDQLHQHTRHPTGDRLE